MRLCLNPFSQFISLAAGALKHLKFARIREAEAFVRPPAYKWTILPWLWEWLVRDLIGNPEKLSAALSKQFSKKKKKKMHLTGHFWWRFVLLKVVTSAAVSKANLVFSPRITHKKKTDFLSSCKKCSAGTSPLRDYIFNTVGEIIEQWWL